MQQCLKQTHRIAGEVRAKVESRALKMSKIREHVISVSGRVRGIMESVNPYSPLTVNCEVYM